MKKTTIIGLGLILALALVATVALAWGPGFGPGFGRGFGGPACGVPPIPNLTAEQSAQIQVLRDGFLKEIDPPFAILSIFHTHFVRRNSESLSRKILPDKRGKCYHIYGYGAMASGHDSGPEESEIIWR